MSVLNIMRGNLVSIPAGSLAVGSDTTTSSVNVGAFSMQATLVTNKQYRLFLETYQHQPYGRFEKSAQGSWAMTRMGPTTESVSGSVSVTLGEAIPLISATTYVAKIVPTADEFASRFKNDEYRKLRMDDNHPVIHVGYLGALAFAAASGGRLPANKDWKYAARGGMEGDKIYATADGSLTQTNAHWFFDHTAPRITAAVGTYPPNPFGLYDMTGNLNEYVDTGSETYGIQGGSWADHNEDDLHVDRIMEPFNIFDGNPDNPTSDTVGIRLIFPKEISNLSDL